MPNCFISYGKGKNVNWSLMNLVGAERSLLIACKYALVVDYLHLVCVGVCACVRF
jgi:hypothetical protein